MSVYGGDSWAREAQHRKRRVDELMLDGLDASSFKKLSDGKFTCLVCPHHPVIDSSLILSMHSKGARHQAALSRLKETKLTNQDKINKRIALLNHPTTSSGQRSRLPSKPLIEQTRKVAFDVLHAVNSPECDVRKNHGLHSSTGIIHHAVGLEQYEVNSRHSSGSDEVTKELQLDFRERREKELKFTSAGWKRDCHGKWYRDENVEFDSDEEDPNICLD